MNKKINDFHFILPSLLKCSLFYLLLLVVVVWTLFPLYWALNTSFQSGNALFEGHFLPETWFFKNYTDIFYEQPFDQSILNSITVSCLTVMVSFVCSILAAMALGRRHFSGKRKILMLVLGVSMFPQVAILAGLFELIRGMGMYNHLSGLVLSYLIFTVPFMTWILTTFIQSVPREIEEAAMVDGAGTLTLLFQIFLPLILPAVASTVILAFIGAWNEFLFALTLTLSAETRTVPVAIALMSGASQYELPWGRIMAASVCVTVPLVFLVFSFQRWIVSGLTSGSLKG